MEYTAIITEVEDGWYMGQCEQVPGAITQGQTIEEVQENLKEAITLVLESELVYTLLYRLVYFKLPFRSRLELNKYE